ncbi:MAG: HD domain-containing protein [Clostridiales bacterium]|nr:HD domain-containing protein [Clostridiales bacterium]
MSASCLLHDIARLEPEHETAGAKLLLTEGYPAAARLVASHMDLPKDYSPEPDETALLYLADKLSRHGRITTPEETLSVLRARFAHDPDALAGAKARMTWAHAILDLLYNSYEITYDDIAVSDD